MARSTARRRRTKANARPKSKVSVRRYRFFVSRRFWMLVALALVAGIMGFLHDPIGKAVFSTLGLGIVIVVPWIALIGWTVRKRRSKRILSSWNVWLGALLLSATVLGVMALYHPPLSIAGASLEEKTLAGSLGHAIAGDSFAWARLLVLALLGVVAMAPRSSRKTAAKAFRQSWKSARPALISLGPRLRSGVRRTTRWLTVQTRAMGGMIRMASRERSAKRRRSTASTVPDQTATAEAKPASPATPAKDAPQTADPPLSVEDVVLPAIDRELPPVEILDEAPRAGFANANNEERAKLIEDALGSYGVEVCVRQINEGPSVTQFGVEPGWARKYKRVPVKDATGKPVLDKTGNPVFRQEEVSKTRVKVERITSLANDLALALAVSDIRIEAPVPGKALVGIEVPNISTAIVSLRSVIESPVFQKAIAKSRLAIALGQGAGGEAAVGDLAKMPHILIAGATGSGKTVCLNCFVSCLLTQATPQEVRLILIDPKRVEMVNYGEVPHLLTPVIVDADKAVDVLRRVTMEMDNRYKRFASVGVRNIDAYNRSPTVTEPMPYVVVIIDELADLMMTTPDIVEPLICRLAQLARATGIHLVVATQRPSVDVITGLIKANFPTRVSFAVVSSIDSRTILDTVGAEKLLGKGDMLYIPPEASKPKRIRGCYVSDEEIDRIVAFWKEWAVTHFPPEKDHVALDFSALSVSSVEIDPFLEKARQIVDEVGKPSASLLQRKLHIGYNRAARLIEQLEEEGLLDADDFDTGRWGGEA